MNLKNTALLGFLTIASTTTHAEENLWLYAQGTDTRPQGSFELKFSNVLRTGKDEGSYIFNDFRPELEYGITDRLTVGASLMIFHHDYDSISFDPFSDGVEEADVNQIKFAGFELGLKYNILSPYKDAFGLSVGFDYEYRSHYRLDGASIDQHTFAPSIYLQKNFVDNRLVFAFKGKMELENRTSFGDGKFVREEEIAFDLAAGVSYRVAPKWFVGLEMRWQSDYLSPEVNGVFDEVEAGEAQRTGFGFPDDLRIGTQYQYGYYFGPSVHYAEEGWWATASLLWQIQGGGDESRNASIRGNKVYDEHEKIHFGLNLGFEF